MKRFYKDVAIKEADGEHQILLDGSLVHTPARGVLALPNLGLANAVADEWRAQKDTVEPAAMPFNRIANTAIDRTKPRFDEVLREALGYALHDLLCHRADQPEELIKLETDAWDPYLNWLLNAFQISLKTTSGIATITQDPKALKALKELLQGLDTYALTAVHNATTLSGSLVMGLALQKGFRSAEEIWQDAHVDENYQLTRWGSDEDAEKLLQNKKILWLAVGRFLEHIKS